MGNFTKIPRFSTLVLLLIWAEKDVVEHVWTLVGVGVWHPAV